MWKPWGGFSVVLEKQRGKATYLAAELTFGWEWRSSCIALKTPINYSENMGFYSEWNMKSCGNLAEECRDVTWIWSRSLWWLLKHRSTSSPPHPSLLPWLKPSSSLTSIRVDDSGLGQGKGSGDDNKRPHSGYIFKVESRFPEVKCKKTRLMLRILALINWRDI